MDDITGILRALSDETRFSIVTILLNHDICAGAVARRLGVSDAAVSQHMKVLRDAGLVESERRGYFTHYRVNVGLLEETAASLSEMAGWVRSPCDPDLEGCTEVRRGRCPADKCSGGCPRSDGDRCPGCTMGSCNSGDATMKVAVTYENGEIFQHFGRTEQFKVYEIQDGRGVSSEVVGNEGRGHGELVGVLRQLGVSVLICGGGDGSAWERVVAQLLTSMDGVESMKNVTVMAATNRPDMIDPALLRPGRFDRMVLVGKPDEASRLHILEVHTRGMPLDGVDLGWLASVTDGYVGADLAALCREAGLCAYREDRDAERVTTAHFVRALERVGPSVDEAIFENYRKMGRDIKKRRTSWDTIPFYG